MEMEKKDKQGKWPLLKNLKLKKDQSKKGTANREKGILKTNQGKNQN